MDPLEIVLDEVALEGLDGITIPTLWIRLESRSPPVSLKLDSYTKEFIWRSLASHPEINFFEMPQERADLSVFDRYAQIDPNTGIQHASNFDRFDCYPVQIVLEEQNGIQGSCVFFKERIDVTRAVRTETLTPCMTVEDAFKRWGRKVVLVASQRMRFRVLIGDQGDPQIKLTDHSYCMLERVGRARWQGELQRDLHACSFKTYAGKMHYMRKSLKQYKLVTMQSHIIRLPTGVQQHSILLLLNRFHVNRRSKYDILMEAISDILSNCPEQLASIITVRDQVGLAQGTFKRVYQYMQTAKLVQVILKPVEQLNPRAGPCNTKSGGKVMARCLKLIKPYGKKTEAEADDDNDDDDDDDDEEARAASGTSVPSEGRFMERDLLSQAYEIILASGTKGIAQSALESRICVGKLEARMMVRILERMNMIKGFMEDEGRQRTTKYISHLLVGQSDMVHHLVKEQERSEELRTIGGQPTPRTPATPKSRSKPKSRATPRARARPKSRATPKSMLLLESLAVEHSENEEQVDEGDSDWEIKKSKARSTTKTGTKKKEPKKKAADQSLLRQTKLNFAFLHSTTKNIQTESPANQNSELESPLSQGKEDGQLNISPKISLDKTITNKSQPEDSITVVEEIPSQKSAIGEERRTQTYRQLKRKNLIIEAVRNLKIIEGVYTLQKLIHDEEKQDGVNTKCCKKSILRVIRSLSKEGLLKLFRTVIIQDGVSKKVEFIVHPSICPNDEVVKSAIEQIRFRISSSYSSARKNAQQEQEAGGGENLSMGKKQSTAKHSGVRTKDKMIDREMDLTFKPSIVPGLSRSLGFQPKMPRLRLTHTFLWYLIYGHPLRQTSTLPPVHPSSSEPIDNSNVQISPSHNTGTGTTPSPAHNTEANPSSDATTLKPQNTENLSPSNADVTLSSVPNARTTDSFSSKRPMTPDMEGKLSPVEKGQEVMDLSDVGHNPIMTVYVDELSWKRFIPPAPLHTDFGPGWALISDVLLCLPLSLFIQIVQISFKVDGLDEYLNDPLKQHYLIRFLPSKMKRQLLHKRKYVFSFYERLQGLVYMGLLQFGPVEKFQDKDQVYIYLKRNCMVVDTTTCEPHYKLAVEAKEFDRRRYTLNTLTDIDNYWFDLLCVCLNTPLGVVRKGRPNKRSASRTLEEVRRPGDLERHRFRHLEHMLKGSREVFDDGVIPGDCQGAGGLDSSFFGHLKRNWIWTCHLLKKNNLNQQTSKMVRLRSLLCKDLALGTGSKLAGPMAGLQGILAPQGLQLLEEDVQVSTEPSSRKQKVRGGKKQKRKRIIKQKDVFKVPHKKKKVEEKKKRSGGHDDADKRALLRMTRQRVMWSMREDSVLMLCRVASHFLNCQMRKHFVPWCVIRDMLHAEFEESLDKTSQSVGRRSRYILKNPQTLLNFKICLAEVYQDKPLIETLKGKKHNLNNPKECSTVFSQFVSLLRQKFSSASGSCDVSIPDTKEQLFSRFKVYAIVDQSEENVKDSVNSTEDIQALVLSNLIQSTLAMSNVQMKHYRSFQTFHTYSQYRQDVLCQVFVQYRKKGLFNRRRGNQLTGPKKNRALPILPMSYQLSQSYYRYFAWRLPSGLCTEVFDFTKVLLANGRGDNHPVTDFTYEGKKKSREEPREEKEDVLERREEQMEVQREKEKEDEEVEAEERWRSSEKEPYVEEKEKQVEQNQELQNQVEQNQELHTQVKQNQELQNQVEQNQELQNHVEQNQELQNQVEEIQELQPQVKQNQELQNQVEQNQELQNQVEQNQELQNQVEQNQELQNQVEEIHELHTQVKQNQELQNQVEQNQELQNQVEQNQKLQKQLEQNQTLQNQAEQQDMSFSINGTQPVPGASSPLPVAPSETDPCVPPELQDMFQFPLESPGGATLACFSLMSLGLLSVHVTIPQHIVVIDSTMVDNEVVKSISLLAEDDDDEDAEEVESRRRMSRRQASHTRYLMMRGYCVPGIVNLRNLNTNDSIVVESCTLRLQLRSTPAHSLFPTQDSPPLDFSRTGPSHLPSLLTRSFRVGSAPTLEVCQERLATRCGYTRDDQEAVAELTAALEAHKAFGLDRQELVTSHTHLEEVTCGRTRGLHQYIQDLLEEELILEVGGSSARLVLLRLAEPWLLTPTQSQRPDRKRNMRDLSEKEPTRKRRRMEMEEKPTGRGGEEKEKGEKAPGEGGDEEEAQAVEKDETEERDMDEQRDTMEEKNEPPASSEPTYRTSVNENAEGSRWKPSLFSAQGDDDVKASDACELSFVSRPWRIVDGSLNSPVCKGMMEAVMLHIMSRPGVTEHALLEHYRGVLQPVCVLDLMQALVELGCVKKKYVTRHRKPSLFSRPDAFPPVREIAGDVALRAGQSAVAFYEPTVDCCLRLGQVFPRESNWNPWLQFSQHERAKF